MWCHNKGVSTAICKNKHMFMNVHVQVLPFPLEPYITLDTVFNYEVDHNIFIIYVGIKFLVIFLLCVYSQFHMLDTWLGLWSNQVIRARVYLLIIYEKGLDFRKVDGRATANNLKDNTNEMHIAIRV